MEKKNKNEKIAVSSLFVRDLTEVPSSELLDSDTVVASFDYGAYSVSIKVVGDTEVVWQDKEGEVGTYSKPSEYPKELIALINRNHTQKELVFVPWEHDKRVISTKGISQFLYSITLNTPCGNVVLDKRGVAVAGSTRKKMSERTMSEFFAWLADKEAGLVAESDVYIKKADEHLNSDELFDLICKLVIIEQALTVAEDKLADKVSKTLSQCVKTYEKLNTPIVVVEKKPKMSFFKKKVKEKKGVI